MSKEYSFPKDKIKIVLLEGVHQVAVGKLKEEGYLIEEIPRSVSAEELMEIIPDAHIVGVRSKTKITAEHIKAGKRLLGIGCFGVGTNQVDLDAARVAGVPVFNAPFGNTRSVAELALCSMLTLARQAGDKNTLMHKGYWDKTAKGCVELRGKTLGVVGYGHIGQQVGLLAEAVGMKVLFYDRIKRLSLGNAQSTDTIEGLLKASDFVTLHVPATPDGSALLGKKELSMMRKGSYVLNLSRGTLIDFKVLREVLESGHLAGAAIDVYPSEPKTNAEEFACELAGVKNVFLTPHIGGSTEEAQYNIGLEVAATFIKLINLGTTSGAVNFPQADLPLAADSHRILNIHKNVPGVLTEVNKIISDSGANIDAQYLSTFKDVGYLIMDISKAASLEVKEKMAALPTSIRTRILF